ncbi:hypothetical protein BGW80DRAFT_1334681 [Lactifluus volemus]|nr:hypothetical protein BGW80DRAFT_1334681 [Lactifluus volemus]
MVSRGTSLTDSVSSYTPTLSTLIESRKKNKNLRHILKIQRLVQWATSFFDRRTRIDGDETPRETTAWLRFACHGKPGS